MMVTDENYIKTYGITLKHGSFFNSGSNLNLRNIILNETAVKVLGWKNTEDVVGREVKFPESNVSFTVQGITKDFHFNSKHERIQPIIFLHTTLSNNYRFLSFKIAPGHTSETIDAIRKKWGVLMPGSSFEYRFMDDALMGMYQTEIQMKKASDVATVLSFIIALMGILGLVSLNVQKKAREISIRKVLGAQITTILFIFIKEFLLVILIAGAMAWPIALYIMKNWLNDYAYRIDISVVPFILSFMILLVSAVLLIVFQTLKAARLNPVKNLRSE